MNILKVLTPRRRLGNLGEAYASKFLRKKGYRILARNYVGKHGEIDIVAKKKNILAFVEVKTRSLESKCGLEARPASAVNPDKQRKLIHVANEYARRTHKKDGVLMRMDIIEIYTEKNENGKPGIKDAIHIENAFDMNSAYQNFRG
jgi:putative endonuclease